MKYKAIFLDFYGTCVAEDDAIIDRIISEVMEHTTATRKEILNAWKFFESCTAAFGTKFRTQQDIELSTLQDLLDQFGVTRDVEDISKELFDYWSTPEVYPDTLGFLRSQKVPIIIVSNIDNSFLDSARSLVDFDFSDVVTSEDARAYKPRPEPFHFALERNRLTPDEVVHIGDSYSSDVVGATKCGIAAVWVNRKNRNKPRNFMGLQVSTLSEIKWDNESAC